MSNQRNLNFTQSAKDEYSDFAAGRFKFIYFPINIE